MKTLAIAVAAAMFALSAPLEASAPAPAVTTVAAECPPGFVLKHWGVHEFVPIGVVVVGPGDMNGDGYLCRMTLGKVRVEIDNRP
jgi:hypothetical protein